MDSEKQLAVSGIMFLITIKSFELFAQLLPVVIWTSEIAPRFGAALLSSTLAIAMGISLGLSGHYLQKYIKSLSKED